MNEEEKKEKTLGQIISRGFTILAVVFLILKYTGLLQRIENLFMR